jgi:hypothetical protein
VYDVVLTTYGTLAAECATKERKKKKRKTDSSIADFYTEPVEEAPKKKEDEAEEEVTYADFRETMQKGPLFNLNWYRVILDEARKSLD